VAAGGNVIFDKNSVTDISSKVRDTDYFFDNRALISATGSQSGVENKGVINTLDSQDLMMANNGAHITNSGTINVKPSGEQFT
ncbi:hypothetical protein OFC55_39170, partial [Escherichia coli]|nr:hypothetical protein [Escherichia coli]